MGQIKQQKLKKKQKSLNSEANPPVQLTFLEHLYELRKRLFLVVLIIVLGSAIGFQYKDILINAVMAPLHGEKLIYLTPGGGFSFIFTVSLYFGVLIAIPFIIYHLFRFLQPILGKSSRRFIAIFMILSIVLAAAGALFGYFVTIPAALDFLSAFAGGAVIPSLTAESYLNFVVTYILGLALIFQLPLLIFMFDHVHPFPPGTLLSSQRFVIIGATVLAAMITPTPDAINMAIVAVPIIVVYQLGAVAVFIRRHQRRATESRMAKKAEIIKPVAAIDMALEKAFLEDVQSIEAKHEPLTASLQHVAEIDTEFALEAAPQPVANQPVQNSQSIQVQHQHRSVDGFVRSRQPVALAVPSRRPAPVVQQRTTSRPVRSIDGFLPA